MTVRGTTDARRAFRPRPRRPGCLPGLGACIVNCLAPSFAGRSPRYNYLLADSPKNAKGVVAEDKEDARLDLLTASDTTPVCPYKGWANYFDVQLPNGEVHKDIVWYYRAPNAECIKITSFHGKKVTVWIDGEKQE